MNKAMKKNIGSCKRPVDKHYYQRKYTRCMLSRSNKIKKDLQGGRDTVSDEALQAGEGLSRNLDRVEDDPEPAGPR